MHPSVKNEVDNEEFIVHIAGGDSEDEELMIEDEGCALLTQNVSVDPQLLTLVADLESYL